MQRGNEIVSESTATTSKDKSDKTMIKNCYIVNTIEQIFEEVLMKKKEKISLFYMRQWYSDYTQTESQYVLAVCVICVCYCLLKL